MSRDLGRLLALSVCFMMIMGCTPKYQIVLNQEKNNVQTEAIKAFISPAYNRFAHLAGFILNIENKTDTAIDLIWEKTWYLQNGELNKNLLFADASSAEGPKPTPPGIIYGSTLSYSDAETIYWSYYVPPETIPAKSAWKKFVFPIALVELRPFFGLISLPLPDGDNGVLMTLKIADREVIEKMVITVKRVPLT